MVRAGVAMLAGGSALGTLALGRTQPHYLPWFAASISLGGITSLAGLLVLLEAYVGVRQRAEAAVGPDPSWIRGKMERPDWGLPEHWTHLLAAFAKFDAYNVRAMTRAGRWRRAGLYTLYFALAAYATGHVYILWRLIP